MLINSRRERWIEHYGNSQRILLVGEGDFSFSACLAKAFGYADNMVATCLHSQETLPLMHRTSVAHVEKLEKKGCTVLYDVDVHIMNKHSDLKDMKFDVIVFNFPHAGHYSWLCERDTILIEMHRALVSAYFKNAKELLERGGEIHVTTRDDEPYNTWEVEKLAINEGLILKEKVKFIQGNYPGYHNKRGGNIQCNKKFPLNYDCYTFKFILKETQILEIDLQHGGSVSETRDKWQSGDVCEASDNGSGSTEANSFITTVEELHT